MAEITTDHDLLIRVDQKVSDLHGKVDKLTDDHERRIRVLEKNKWLVTGAATALATAANFLIDILKN